MKYPLVSYVLENTATFAQDPFNEADSLVLSTLSYCYLERGALGDLSSGARVPLPLALCGIPYPDLFGNIFLGTTGGPEFVGAVLQSPRFAPLQISNVVSRFSEADQLQFAAMTVHLPDQTAYVAFRGTDSSVAGWKEDFNLSFMREIPSQKLAREYVETVAASGAQRIVTGGHSKGGNLSEYAALTCNDETFRRIAQVYNFDGPAFAFAPSERMNDLDYAAKLHKIVPGSSIFGMIMEGRSSIRVVKAQGVMLQQHAATRWVVEDGAFVNLDGLSPEAEAFDRALYNWTELNDPLHREELVEALFNTINATEIDEWADLATDPLTRIGNALKAVSDLPPDVRNALLNLGTYLARESLGNLPKPGSSGNSGGSGSLTSGQSDRLASRF